MDIDTGIARVLLLFEKLHRLAELIREARRLGQSTLDHEAWHAIEHETPDTARAAISAALSSLDNPPP